MVHTNYGPLLAFGGQRTKKKRGTKERRNGEEKKWKQEKEWRRGEGKAPPVVDKVIGI